MPEMKRKRKFAERDSGYGQPFWLSWYSDSDCGGKCISTDSLRGDSDLWRFSDNVYSAAPGGGCAGIYGGLTAWRAGAVRSRNPRQPGRACRAAREPADEASGVSGRGCLEDHCLVSEKGQRAVLLGRCIPIIRSLISVPAGMAGMKMPGFLLYTIVGSTVWNLLLVGIGAAVGAAWEQAAEYVKLYADVVFLILMVGTVCFPAFHLYRKKHRQK